MQAPEEFVRKVSHALSHLYDPDVLRAHPLIDALGLAGRDLPQAALRDTLVSAIESLIPEPSVPIESRLWRVYKILQLRYIQQMDQDQTAYQIGVGVRHLRREQKAAVEILADALYRKMIPVHATATPEREDVSSVETELSWLKTAQEDNSATLRDTLLAAYKLVLPLADKRGIALELAPMPDLPAVALVPAALRQSIVSMTTCAIGRLPEGKIHFEGRYENDQVRLELIAHSSQGLIPESESCVASLNAVHAILGDLAGKLVVTENRNSLQMILVLPVRDVAKILLIDDNRDVAELFKRYLFGTRYRIEAITNPDELFNFLAQSPVDFIILDVMMPGIDGWEVLGRLVHHPLTSAIPVVVCTVLPERDLAIALGAVDYLAKPVSRDGLLTILNRFLARNRQHFTDI